MSIFFAPRDRSVWAAISMWGPKAIRAHATECREPANRWHEESKRRYEELTRQWL
jgi:hypothetical protein